MKFNAQRGFLIVAFVLLEQREDVQAQVTVGVTTQNIAENSAIGTTVESFFAVGGIGPYTFTLETTTNDFELTTIGDLMVKAGGVLDYETVPTHELQIKIVDSIPITSTVTFTVSVTDVNDVPTFAEPFGYVLLLVSGGGAGTVVGIVTATDEDTGTNGDIHSYVISGGNTGSTFVASTTGVISVDTGKTADDLPYILTYEARDAGTLTATTTILVIPPICGTATANSIGIMALALSLVFQTINFL